MNLASAFVTGAELVRRPPAPQLRPFVGCFWALPCTTTTRVRSLPDGCATLSVELADGGRPRSFITGPRLAPAEWTPDRTLTLIGVRLRPGVLFALTRVPAAELAGRRMRLDRWCGMDASRLEVAIGAASAPDGWFDALEAFVRDRLEANPVDVRIVRAMEVLSADEGRTTIVDLARRCGTSVRHIDRLFRRWVGLSPKALARVLRFQASLASLDPVSAPALAALAAGRGYFDQAHLSNEFARLAGLSPRRIAPARVADFSKTQCE